MASLQNRKRRCANNPAEESPPAKKIKSTTAAHKASNFPSAFWDNLSKVGLTPRALRELDRRNSEKTLIASAPEPLGVIPTSLVRFARRGGPDLYFLRACPEPKHAARISSDQSSTKATSVSSKAKRSSAYDGNFEQHLIEHNIFPEGYEYPDDDSIPEPRNLDDIAQALSAPRASLSPSRFPRSTFKQFTLANDRVISEGKVMSSILPIISGNVNIPSERNLPFNNLDSMTDGTTVVAVPDLYDGSYSNELDKTVRQDLDKIIVPTSHGRAPVLPNFFFEAKAPRGGADVAKRQACLDGAVGARALNSLQNYGVDEPVYDGNAHTFSSTYHAGTGTLQMYAHHVTGPRGEGETPGHHMTQVDAWGMTGNFDTFRRGATAFRNARDMARQQRESFIQAANSKASQAREVAAEAVVGKTREKNS